MARPGIVAQEFLRIDSVRMTTGISEPQTQQFTGSLVVVGLR